MQATLKPMRTAQTPADRISRPACDVGGAAVVQQRGKPLAGGLVGQDAILVAVDDQDGNADRGANAAEVFQAGCDAAERGVGRRGDSDVKLFCHAWSLTRLPSRRSML